MDDFLLDIENIENKPLLTNADNIYISECIFVVKTIASALRNFLLYPEDHSLSKSSLINVSSELSKFIERFGTLVLHINKDSLYLDDTKIMDNFGEEDGLVYPLFRDGVLKLEFYEGINHLEIKTLFKILKKNRVLPDEPESDTVTDLWQAALTHIKYEAADIFWDTEPVFSFPKPHSDSEIISVAEQGESNLCSGSEDGPPSGVVNIQNEKIKSVSLAGLGFEGSALSLKSTELHEIRQMVLEEECEDNSKEILNLLLYLVDESKSAEDFKIVLNNLTEEFRQVFKEGNLKESLRIIDKVKSCEERAAQGETWISPAVNEFTTGLSGPVFYDLMFKIIPFLNNADDQYLILFNKICMNLDPSIIIFLSEIIPSIDSTATRTCLLDIIQVKIREDDSLINNMIESPDKRIVNIVISVLKSIKNKKSDILLYKLLKHPADIIRSKALDYFLGKPRSILPRIFFMIDDPNIEVRGKVLKYIAGERLVPSETLMLNYMEKRIFLNSEKNHLLNCYKSLGFCGSSRSIPFLKEKLLDKAWMSFVGSGNSIHRKGAAIALKELKIQEATDLLKKASKSKYPVVLNAYKFMIKINSPGNK